MVRAVRRLLLEYSEAVCRAGLILRKAGFEAHGKGAHLMGRGNTENSIT